MSNIITSDIDCENMNHMIDLEIEAVKLSNIVKFIQKKLFSFIHKGYSTSSSNNSFR